MVLNTLNKIKTHFITVIMIMSLSGCSKSISEKIIDRIEHQFKNSKECIIEVKDITHFDWDKMYVFYESATVEEMENALGFKYDNLNGGTRHLIFTRKNKVVYHEEDYPDPSKPSYGKVIFMYWDNTIEPSKRRAFFVFRDSITETPNGKKFIPIQDSTLDCEVFTKNTAIFNVKKIRFEGFTDYELYPHK
jgi:hypothetical protein